MAARRRPFVEDNGDCYYEEDLKYYEDYDSDDSESSSSSSTVEWESLTTDAGSVYVVLPPPSVLRPTAIVHFCGGTVLGSAPQLWYQKLLQELVEHTDAVVVASTIPVTLWKSPLQHVQLARQLESQFQQAYEEVLLDEYGSNIAEVPVCGMGHSLGARLLTVLATLPPRGHSRTYKSYILISFTNFGAAAGIPGLQQLTNAAARKQKKQRAASSRRQRRYNDDDNYDWEDFYDSGLLSDLQSSLQLTASKLRTTLTPDRKDLEFYPSPQQLWDALEVDQRYEVNTTLLVQFDNDPIDQSSRLASILQANGSSTHFCRLRGTHLSPVPQFGKETEVLALRQSISRYLREVVSPSAGSVDGAAETQNQ